MNELFWATLKTEFIRLLHLADPGRSTREVARWIEIVYNRSRGHLALDYSSPVAFETASKAAAEIETKAEVFTQAA